MALVKTENKGTNQIQVEISVDAKVFDDACNRVYRKNVKKIAVPGFRVGKAPRKMIEKRYGDSIFYDEAIEIVYPKALQEGIEEAKLEIVAVESLEPVNVSAQEGCVFTALCITKPEVSLDNYKGMKIEKSVNNITDKEVEEEVGKIRERNGRLITVEDRAAQDGDTVIIDFEGFVDGTPFEGGKAEKHSLKLGSGQFIPGFEEQIVGKNIGEEFDVNVKFPEDYQAEDLKGKESVFKCKLHEIKETELPDLDDEFAKDVSEFDTLDELKADMKQKMQETENQKAEEMVEKQIVDCLIESLHAEIPEVMFEQKIDDLIRNFEYRLSSQGISLEMYMQYTGLEKDAFREQFKEQAQRMVQSRLALEKIVALENIEPDEQAVKDEIEKLAKEHQMTVEKVESLVAKEDIQKDLAVQKAMDLLKDNAEYVEKKETKTAKSTTATKSKSKTKTTTKKTAKSTAAKKTTTTKSKSAAKTKKGSGEEKA